MVALLLYAYSTGVRSARGIERRCSDDVAFRVICANQVPDHATIARFRARHEQAISELFSGVLSLCARAGLVKVGIVAIDPDRFGTAAASIHRGARPLAARPPTVYATASARSGSAPAKKSLWGQRAAPAVRGLLRLRATSQSGADA